MEPESGIIRYRIATQSEVRASCLVSTAKNSKDISSRGRARCAYLAYSFAVVSAKFTASLAIVRIFTMPNDTSPFKAVSLNLVNLSSMTSR